MEKGVLLGALLYDLTSAIVTALGADPVVDYSCTAVGAGGKCRDGGEIVSTPLVSSLLGEFVFRMCHCCII